MMESTTRAGSRIALACASAWLSGVLVVAPALASTPTLYHSTNGVDPNPQIPVLAPNGIHTLSLYLMPGGVDTMNGGAICNDGAGGLGGDGDETCGVHFEILVDGDLEILSFAPSVGQASSMIAPDGKKLTAALVTTSAPLSQNATLLGTLSLDSGPVGGAAEVAMLETVDANLDLQTGSPRDIVYVPEPRLLLLLAGGLCALVPLARRRS